jgi:PTS system nitrogen regulatory IIA component
MSTGIGMGVAVPHVRLDSVSDIVMAAAIVHEGIEDYETLDNVSVKLVFMIAATPEQHAQYLRLLSSLSKHLKNEIFRHQLIDCESGVDFYNKLGQEK